MKILNTLEDDFPCPVNSAVEPKKYYEAFLKAEGIIAAAPKRYQEDAESRLPELMSYLYRGGDAAAALYRKRNDASEIFSTLWLSAVRRLANWFVAANMVPEFKGLDQSVLAKLPRQFKDPDKLIGLNEYLNQFGVILVWEQAIPGAKLDGAVFSLPSGRVVVALSLRYSRLDYFWFTLLHELAHVALHPEKLEAPIVDDMEAASEDLIEKQADRLASDSLIPRNEWRSCPARFSNSIEDIVNFANQQNIPAQCVAGRLQRDLSRYDLFSEIINKYDVREILNGKKP